ncbi:cellulose synthase operon protein YhjQ [Pseudomonas sp. HN11]|uniref:cellulose biosynthesis protein BcsQ n=1 Tax=Pseudomonas sp. HN11 TaxID=1344094 RepID=UPI001EEF7126|nr:cellulose biosynthesis protein BcsQ [Pseudomonas sp. HN11]UII71865.1 cellulose synthase operon protein YhjQ [Pseudomonas sp. HN11]
MSRADDISKLFNKLGANPNGYREIDFVQEYLDDEVMVLEKPIVVDAAPVIVEPPAVAEIVVEEVTVAPLQRLLEELSQGEADHLHPPEVVEGPEGEVYSERTTPGVVVVVSLKGGVGRSTLTAALASGLQRQGRPALALDLDPQNALRHHLCLGLDIPGVGAASLQNESWEALPERGFAGCRLVTFGPTDHEQQQRLNRWLGQDSEWLSKRFAGLKLNGQDTVFIDVPAGNTVYLSQAMSVADTVLVVVQPDVSSFGALAQMDDLLAPYLGREKPPRCFYVINQLDAAHRFSLDMAEVFKTRLGNALLGMVHRDPTFSEAQAYRRDPLDPTINSIGCQDVHALCRALLERIDSDLP